GRGAQPPGGILLSGKKGKPSRGEKVRPLLVLAPGARPDALGLGRLPKAVTHAVKLLVAEGAPEEELVQVALGGGIEAAARLHVALAWLTQRGLLHHVIRGPRGEWARLE